LVWFNTNHVVPAKAGTQVVTWAEGAKLKIKETHMIQAGDKLPGGKLWELAGEWENTCSLGASDIDVEKATAGKRIVMFGIPAAFTKT
jgi:hypothetical protein